MEIGYIGLGKMGQNMVLNLLSHQIEVVVWNRSPEPVKMVQKMGATPARTLVDLVKALPSPRIIWIMLPQGALVDKFVDDLSGMISQGDIIIDGGNSFFRDSLMRAEKLKSNGIHFMDVGTSGGPNGAKEGACLMIGGERDDYQRLVPLWQAVSARDGYEYLGPVGAGHFAKMIHNGIEYGMMEAIAEGAAILKKSGFDYDLAKLFSLYNHQSVISSRLVGWAEKAFLHNPGLDGVTSIISHTGEGDWTVKIAEEMGISVPVIQQALQVRIDSSNVKDNFRNRVVSALRGQFGGHRTR